MAEETLAPASDGGASVEGAQQAAEPTSQEAGKSQSSEGASVDSSSTKTSSVERRERGNQSWASQRVLEKTIEKQLQKALQEQLSPILERLSQTQTNPPAAPGADQPDYNDLSGWLNRRVEALMQERLRRELPQHLSSFKNEIKNQTKTQEARAYLIAQQDVGSDQQKLEEIEQTMISNGLHYMAEHDPLGAVQLGYQRWKESKNRNAPPKSQLSGISGGAGTSAKREPTPQEIERLKQRLISNPTMEEAKQIEKEIQTLLLR